MTKEEIQYCKGQEQVKFFYKIPCSLFEEGFQYIIVGEAIPKILKKSNVRCFTMQQWFDRIESGSLLPYVCCRLSRTNKLKEYLNIYKKPDVVKMRKFFSKLVDANEIIQESNWAVQYIKEGKVNRPDAFTENIDPITAVNNFYEVVDPIYNFSLYNNSNG